MITRIASLVFLAAFALSSSAALADGDADKGKKVFNKCKACHALEAGKNKIGPSLAGIIGRPAGSVEGFKYSEAMKDSGITWTVENIDTYLANPKDFVPKNKMVFVGLKKEEDRQNLIAYLQQEAQ